jgi:UDP-glucose 4-epimerase
VRVSVVGGAGFIGRYIVERLLDDGADVLTVDRRYPREPLPGESFLQADVVTREGVQNVITTSAGADAVVWLVADIRQNRDVDASAQEDLDLSVEAPLYLLRGIEPTPRAFVYTSSIQVYGRPQYLPVDEGHPLRPFTAYGVAKLCGERFLAIQGTGRGAAVACLRLAFVYGPDQHEENVLQRFVAAARRGEAPLVHGSGDELRDDVYVRDVADAVARVLAHRVEGAFNIASGKPHTLLDVANAVCRAAGGEVSPRHDDEPSGWIDRWYNVERAAEAFGFEPTTEFEQGVRELWATP